MDSCRKVTIDGFNEFLRKQKAVKGEGTITLVQFDDNYEVNYEFLPLQNAPLLNEDTYQPRGMTALLDAIGRTIDSTGKRLAAMPEDKRPFRVIFVIQTDGLENASSEYVQPEPPVTYSTVGGNIVALGNIQHFDKAARVRAMVEHQRDRYNWDFIVLGAGQNAVLEAQKMGINAKSALTYDTSNSTSAFASAGVYTTSYRCAVGEQEARLCAFSDEDRASAVSPTSNSTDASKTKKTVARSKVTTTV